MPYTNEISLARRLKVALTGEPGTGKTLDYADFPGSDTGEMYVFDFDKKIKTVKRFYPNKRIQYDEYDNTNLHKAERKLEELIRNPPETVVADSLTFFAYSTMSKLLDARGTSEDNRGEGKKGKKFSSIAHIDIPEMAEWLAESRALAQFLLMCKDLPCHFIMTAHLIRTETTNPMTGITRVSREFLAGGKKITAMIPGMFDEIWHCRVEYPGNPADGLKYKVYTIPLDEDAGPVRTALPLPSEFDVTYPNNPSLFKQVERELEREGIKFMSREEEAKAAEEERMRESY